MRGRRLAAARSRRLGFLAAGAARGLPRVTTMTATATDVKPARAPLALGALVGVLGVVYGDIGTSPLYALQSVLALFPGKHAGAGEVLGCLSLIFWSLFLIV